MRQSTGFILNEPATRVEPLIRQSAPKPSTPTIMLISFALFRALRLSSSITPWLRFEQDIEDMDLESWKEPIVRFTLRDELHGEQEERSYFAGMLAAYAEGAALRAGHRPPSTMPSSSIDVFTTPPATTPRTSSTTTPRRLRASARKITTATSSTLLLLLRLMLLLLLLLLLLHLGSAGVQATKRSRPNRSVLAEI